MNREEILSEIAETIEEIKSVASNYNGDILDACYTKNRIEVLTDKLRDLINEYDNA